MNKFEKNLLQGNVVKKLMAFMLPFIITNLIQSLYSIVDMMIVGRFGGAAGMSGVGNGGQIMGFVTNLISGLCVGGTVVIGQYLGSGKKDALKKTIATLFTIIFILAVFFTLFLVLLRNQLLSLIKTPTESFSEAGKYLFVSALGTVFIFGYNVLSAVMRGMGDSKKPFVFITVSCVLNVVLDLILVAGFEMGAEGAAVATVTSQAISMLLCIFYLVKNEFIFDFRLSSFKIHKEIFTILMKVGLPSSVQNFMSNIAFLFLSSVVNSLGVIESAAVSAAGQFYGFGVLPACAMSVSVAAMSAQNLGAGEVERATSTVKYGFIVSFCIGIVVFLVTQLFPKQILGIFSDDSGLIEVGVSYLRIISLDFLIVPLLFSVDGLFIGSGHTVFSFVNNVLSVLAVRVPVAYFLGIVLDMGLLGIGIAAPLASFVALVSVICFYKTGKWKNIVVHR